MDAKLAGILLDLQKNRPSLVKDATNPHFKNKYVTLDATLDAVLPLLNERGIALVQAPTAVGPVPGLRTQLIHESGEVLVDETMPLTLDKVTPQGQGSAITYARRYAIFTILALVGEEDDDGNAASTARRTRTVKPKDTESATEGSSDGDDDSFF